MQYRCSELVDASCRLENHKMCTQFLETKEATFYWAVCYALKAFHMYTRVGGMRELGIQ